MLNAEALAGFTPDQSGSLPIAMRELSIEESTPRQDPLIGINPRFLNIESFQTLDGVTQEAALLNLMKSEDSESVARLRPDFDMSKPLTSVEKIIYDAIDGITRREKPIKGPHPMLGDLHDDWQYTKVAGMIYDHDLPRKLEEERLRRAQTPGLFFSSEMIGNNPPARRYRRLLELEAERQLVEEAEVAAEMARREELKRNLQVINGNKAA